MAWRRPPVTGERPDPEVLLARAREEEARKARGRLKLFFGSAAGVGKTYAMLEAARELRADGVDVVVGVVETHGRAETESLLEGLEILPPRQVAYRGSTLKEFDLDAALARRPAVILVDELAHSNAEGSRHAKRWQDVLELVDAGINVYTALNVQHLESLNDLVAKITGVIVRETVPDSVLERADEIELVDLPPDELIQRLQEGKVYLPQQAQEAMHNFFRKGNLIALRELALRRTADRVDAQMQAYMRDHAIAKTWPVAERVLVCVSPSPQAGLLVRAGRRARHAPGGRVDRRLRRDAGEREAVGGRPRAGRADAASRRAAGRGDRDTLGPHHERGDPELLPGPERQQDRHRQARPVPVEADSPRLHRGRSRARERRHRYLCGQRRQGRGRPEAGEAARGADGLARLSRGAQRGRPLHGYRLAHVPVFRPLQSHHGLPARRGGGRRAEWTGADRCWPRC